MRILFLKPPRNGKTITNSLYEPLELEYLAASVKEHDCRILDMRIDRNLRAELSNFRPGLVGITAYTTDYNSVVRIMYMIRAFDPSIKTVVGGHHATFSPEDFVLPCVDAIFLGYADHTFPEYVNSLDDEARLKKIPNIGLVRNGSVFYTKKEFFVPDLNTLPMPDRSLTSKYRRYYHDPVRNRMTLMMTSRGCQFRCNFCACWKMMDGKYTSRTPESIIEELKLLPEEIDIVYFSDDNTFSDINRMWRLSELIKKNNIRKKLQMYARADTIVKHEDLFEELTGAGLQFITIGLESSSDNDLVFFNKKTSISVNNQAIQILKRLNIYQISTFIIRPEFTVEDFNHLLEYIYEQNLFRPSYPILTPLPGTDLYSETCKEIEVMDYDLFDFAHSVLPTNLEPKEFYRQVARIYMKSFSLWRYFKHRIYRFFKIRKERYYTDNTDGLTASKLIAMDFLALILYFKLRYFAPVITSNFRMHKNGLNTA